jgi:hypothetical protein
LVELREGCHLARKGYGSFLTRWFGFDPDRGCHWLRLPGALVPFTADSEVHHTKNKSNEMVSRQQGQPPVPQPHGQQQQQPLPVPKITQYRVDVREGMLGGNLIRAGFNGHEWLVRVPAAAQPGDSFIFTMTEADHQAYLDAKHDSTLPPYTNETAFLENRQLLLQQQQQQQLLLQQQQQQQMLQNKSAPANSGWVAWLLNDLLIDPQRIVFLGSIFVLSFVFGLVLGVLSYTQTYIMYGEDGNRVD